MNAAAVPFAQARRLSHAQLGEVLWADPLTRVHAVVMGERVAGLEERLAAAEGEYDSLWPGALTPSQRSAAPWMVRLARGSALAEWLLFQAVPGPLPLSRPARPRECEKGRYSYFVLFSCYVCVEIR